MIASSNAWFDGWCGVKAHSSPPPCPALRKGGANRCAALSLLVAALLISTTAPSSASAADAQPAVLVVVGAPGTDEFAKQFTDWAGRWEAAANRGEAEFTAIGLDKQGQTTDRDRLREWLAQRAGASPQPVWLVLIGHGTFDGKTARFNLRGADVTPADLAEWLTPLDRPLAIVNCASSSGPFLNALSGTNRVVITATRSGHEYNFARFGDYLSAAIADSNADLDKDEQTSLLEAFLLASANLREFYSAESRLATEHALLDDNGDKLGTPADWFQGLRVTKSPKAGAAVDGLRAGQFHLVRSRHEVQLSAAARARRDDIEQELAAMRRRRSELPEDDYLAGIEPLLLELARLYSREETPGERGQ